MAERKVPYEAVGQVERDYSPEPPSYTSKRSAKEKLGVYNIIVLIIGTLIILLAVAFLSFIWIVAVDGTYRKDGTTKTTMPALWKLIATRGWVSRVVTLSAILIRTATAAQLCVFAAIMAALILERVGASSQDFPLLSMIRCANTGPQALIWNVLRTLKTGAQRGYSALIMVTILNAIALQFTSTILLADIGLVPVVLNDTTYGNIFYGISDTGENGNNTNSYAGVDFWKTGPQTYPRFAERPGNSSNGTNFTDTGATYRGFLPFTDPDVRMDLRSYYGPMEVFDARVVCVKPTLSNLRLWPNFAPNDSDISDAQYILSGNLNIDGVYPSGLNTKPIPGGNLTNMWSDFNCSAPVANFVPGGTYGNGSICVLGTGYAQLLNPIIPETNDTDLPLGSTIAQLFINGTVVNDDYSKLAPKGTTLQQMDSSQDGWARFGNKDMTFDVSYCFFNPRSQDYDVIAVALEDWSDNYAFWDNSTGVNILNTSWIEQGLNGVTTNATPEDRGQMTLYPQDIYGPWSNSTAAKWFKQNATSIILDSLLLNNDDFGITYQLSPFSWTSETMHRLHADLFTKLVRKTNNPALAIQGLWTVLLQMAYYDFSGLYDVHDDALYGISTELNIPWRFNCFIGIMCLLGLHFILIIIAVVLFLKKTEMSLLGNSWQAVSQVMSNDTANTVHHGAMRTDQEMMKTSRDAPQRMYIGRSDATGRTEAISALAEMRRR